MTPQNKHKKKDRKEELKADIFNVLYLVRNDEMTDEEAMEEIYILCSKSSKIK